VFENYSASDAFRALEKVFSETPDSARLIQVTLENASVSSFVANIEQAIGL
jgi:hypothetical protein